MRKIIGMSRVIENRQENALNRRMRRMVRYCIKEGKRPKTQEYMTGIAFVNNPEQYFVVRIMWIVLLVTCFGRSILQTCDRIKYYFRYPTAVDVLIKEKPTLPLPGITFCVQETDQFQEIKKKCHIHEKGLLACVDHATEFLKKCYGHGVKYEAIWNAMNTSSMVTSRIKQPKNYTISSWRQTLSMVPMATCITLDTDQLMPTNLVTTFDIRIPEGACTSAVLRGTIQEARNDADWAKAWGLTLTNELELRISKKEYMFVSRPGNECVQEDTFKSCHRGCLNDGINKSYTCRFPFLPESFNKPNCDDPSVPREAVINQYTRNAFYESEWHPVTYCNCTRRCKEVIYSLSLHILGRDKNYTRVTLQFLDAYETKIVDRLAYKLSDLLCDIGGNIGLYLGMSLLSIINVFYLLYFKFTSKFVKPFDNNDPIYNKVVKYYNTLAFKSVPPQPYRRIFNCLSKYLLTALCGMGSCSFIYLRLAYYYSYPTRINAITLQNETVTFPCLTICGENKWLTIQKLKAARKSKVPCNQLDLFDPFVGKTFNSTVVWEKVSLKQDVIDFAGLAQTLSIGLLELMIPDFIKSTPLPFGNCVQLYTGTRKYAGLYSAPVIVIKNVLHDLTECIPKMFKVFISAADNEIDITSYLTEPRHKKFSLIFLRKDIRLVNTPNKPCVTNVVYKTCRVNCLKKLLLERVNCSLPYMRYLNLPDCSTVKTARAATETYIRTAAELKSDRACACTKRCNTTLLEYSELVEEIGIEPFVTAGMMAFESNIVQIYFEEQIYSVAKFLCDVGGNLGITLGLSVLSMFETMQAVFIFIKNIVTKYQAKS